MVHKTTPLAQSGAEQFARRKNRNDVGEIVLREAATRSGVLRFRKPLRLTPTISEAGRFLLAEEPKLGISLHAETREELVAELADQIDLLWHEYALEKDENLSVSARELKRVWLQAVEEAPE